jgi:phage-related protein
MSFQSEYSYNRDRIAEEFTYSYFVTERKEFNIVRPFVGTKILTGSKNGSQMGTFLNPSTTPGQFNIGFIGLAGSDPGMLVKANKPFQLHDNGEHQHAISLQYSGTGFGFLANRDEPNRIYVYSLGNGNTVKYFEDQANGVNGTAGGTMSLNYGETGVFTTSSTDASDFIFLTSTQPMAVSKESNASVDTMVLRPARSHVYYRRPDGINGRTLSGRTLINTAPSVSNANNPVQFDTTHDIIVTEVGDGAGSDACPGVGFEDLNNNYAVAHELTDFAIISPHSDTVVDIFYVTGTADNVSGKYVKYKTISSELATGTKENPGYYFENGAGTADQEGVDTAILGDGLLSWKFEGNKPFMLVCNDPSDDEQSIQGWNSVRATPSYGSSISFRAENSNWYGDSFSNFLQPRGLNNITAKTTLIFEGDNKFTSDLLRKIETSTTGQVTGEIAISGTDDCINFNEINEGGAIFFNTGIYGNISGFQVANYSVTPISNDFNRTELNLFNNRVSPFLCHGTGFISDKQNGRPISESGAGGYKKFDVIKAEPKAMFSGSEASHSRVDLTRTVVVPKATDFELSFTAQLSGYTNGDSNSTLQGGHFFADNSTSAKRGRIAYYHNTNRLLVRMDDSSTEDMNTLTIPLNTPVKIRVQKHGNLYSGFIANEGVDNESNIGSLTVSTDDDFRFSTIGGTIGNSGTTNVPPLQGSVCDVMLKTGLGPNPETFEPHYATKGYGNLSGRWRDLIGDNHGTMVGSPGLMQEYNSNDFDNYFYVKDNPNNSVRVDFNTGTSTTFPNSLVGIDTYTGIITGHEDGSANRVEYTRTFFFEPDTEVPINIDHDFRKNHFRESFHQTLNVSRNQNRLGAIELKFTNRGDQEAYAILHFLESHLGYKPFVYKYQSNHIIQNRVFFCDNWSHTFDYINSNTITATFKEIPNPRTPSF